ncbi:FtsX-like permease family protein [Succinivibrio sp.]|uniref:FtsX-like permease family protein n=1 Tax=Succinivibrio sp. TaxID=2053619 RepID=UPI003866F43D
MRTSLSVQLALRFLNSKRYGALAKFISISTTSGICVGVCALILGLSAMNGFEKELNYRVLSLIPAGEIKAYDTDGFHNVEQDIQNISKTPHITAVSPVITINGAFSSGTQFAPAAVMGIDLEREGKVISLENFMNCKISVLKQEDDLPAVILGNGIAKKLNLKTGDEINLSSINAEIANNGLGSVTVNTFKIAGLFKTGGQIDSNLAFINIESAKKISGLANPNTFHIGVDRMLEAREIIYEATSFLRDAHEVSVWTDTQGKLYSDIHMIRTIMYIAMILVIAVSCFNIVSNLIMAVSEKRHEIAILMTMGASKRLIVRCFTLMGVFSAIRGCVYGTLLGCTLSYFTPYVTSNFKQWFGIELLNEDIYFINYVPSELQLFDVAVVIFCAIMMSFLASVYPAKRASKIQPAQELNV